MNRNTLFFGAALASLVSIPIQAAVFNTYAAWSDRNQINRGRIYVYSGPNPVNVEIYNAHAPNTEINNLILGPVAAGPFQPVAEHFITMAGNQQYFRLQTNELIVWEIEEDLRTSGDDSHDFLAAADTGRYRGSVFMTYMRDLTANSDPLYGDLAAVINPPNAAGPITISVSKWAGIPPAGAWGAVLVTSVSVAPGGIWMWSPSQVNNYSGGTDGAAEGHYRFNISGGQGMLYKGNSFIRYSGGDCAPPGACSAGPERDNMLLFGVDVNTGKKVGTDLLGAAEIISSAPHISVTNGGSASANFDILHFQPTSPPVANYPNGHWPIDSSAPNGTWVTVTSQTLAPDRSYGFDNNPNTGYGKAGFFRVVSTNGQDLSASFGASLIQSNWCDGDYMFASDTKRAFGRKFTFGGKTFGGSLNIVELHAIAIKAGTKVDVTMRRSSDNAVIYSNSQTATQNRAGLNLAINLSAIANNTFYTVTIESTGLIYAYVMSSNTNGSDGGETFFSVPPPIDPFFTVTKSVSKSVVQLGETIAYYLTGENPGYGSVNNASIWDTLPANVSLVSASPAPDVSSPPFYAWTNLGGVNSGEALRVTVTVVVNSGSHLDVVSNVATGSSDITEPYESNTADFTILAPGPELVKSANVALADPGDTITYTLAYTDQRPPLISPISGLDLKVRNNGVPTTSSLPYTFEISNNSGGSIDAGDLMICYWISNAAPLAAYQFNTDYGGGTAPWAWGGGTWNGTATAFGPSALPANRQADTQICWDRAGSDLLPNGTTHNSIQLRLALNFPQTFADHSNDYSRDPGGVAVDDHHFALYYQGQLVTETGVESGCTPYYLKVEDNLDSRLTYLSSSPAGVWDGSKVSWEDDCVRPAAIRNYEIRAVVKASAAGQVIPNAGNYEILTGPGISSNVNVTISGSLPTPTYTLTYSATPTPAGSSTNTPTASPTPSPSATVTISATPSASPSPTITRTPIATLTATATSSVTPSPTATPAKLILHPNAPSPNPGGEAGIWIGYYLSVMADVTIDIFTVAGEKVKGMDPVTKQSGNQEQFWDARNEAGNKVATGVYPYRITATTNRDEKQDVWGKLAIVR